jgi:isoquinoline 1-oxidoreductase subunit beta
MTTVQISRREFLKASAAASAGLTLSFYLPASLAQTAPGKAGTKLAADSFSPNAFVRIGADDTVTVMAKHVEMGQGSYTGLATLVAEELDADWSKVKVEGAPADAKTYNNLLWGPVQGTGGSTAISNSYEQLRKAGAATRAMLVAAAADEWNVPTEEIKVERGVISHGEHKASFGQLAKKAAAVQVPAEVKLKDPKDFVYIGKPIPRKDSKAKCNGTARFTIDMKLPGMLTAVVAHPPRFGAKPKSFDASQAKAVKGVVEVVQIPEGVAVLATNFWAAKQGRDALKVEWDDTKAFKFGSDEILAQYKELASKPGAVARKDGEAERALAGAAKTVEAAFEFPFLAHAAMEPMNCVVSLGRDTCEVWNGEQFQTVDQANIAAAVGMKPEQVKINQLYAGGSFGRRANPHSDYPVEAAHIAKAINGRAPIKLQWTREDDTRAGYFRPIYYHVLRAGLDASGNPVAWQHRIVGQSILKGTPFAEFFVKEGIDMTSVEGAGNLPYSFPNLFVDLHFFEIGVPV